MKSLTLLSVLLCLCTMVYSQTPYTGLFYSPNTQGVATDGWFNLKPQSGATASNNWNVYHTDGTSSLFSVWYGATQPSVKIGLGRVTNLVVNGSSEVNASGSGTALMRVRHTNETEPTWGITVQQNSDKSGRISCGGCDLQVESGWTGKLILGNDAFETSGGRVIIPGGNVGIGTYSPDARLAVNGQVHAKEVKVTVNVPGPDYVFMPDYSLTPIEELKTYIDQNKHLPEIPTAKEMETNGIRLGEMNMLLLKKIEELTLYVIELKGENEDLRRQQKDIDILKEKLASIESKLR